MYTEFDFERKYRLVREVVETLVLTILMFLIIRLAVQNFNIDGVSMEPTLHNTELVLVDKWSYQFHDIKRGDIIVFIAPPAARNPPNTDFIKRVIGLPGDVVSVNNGVATVNGVTLNEGYVSPRLRGTAIGDQAVIDRMVVPPNMYFVLGDDRKFSFDSRGWGFVPRENIIGRAAMVYWPLNADNLGFPPDPTAVYTGLH